MALEPPSCTLAGFQKIKGTAYVIQNVPSLNLGQNDYRPLCSRMELVSNANAGQEKTFLYKVGKKEENIANIQIAFAKKTVTPRNHNE